MHAQRRLKTLLLQNECGSNKGMLVPDHHILQLFVKLLCAVYTEYGIYTWGESALLSFAAGSGPGARLLACAGV